MGVKIREATPEDAPEIVRVQVATWRTAYAGLLPADFLARLPWEDSEQRWRESLGEPEEQGLAYVAEDERGRVVGFANGGPNRGAAPGYDGELYAIYVLKEHAGRGIGRALALSVARRLERLGMGSMVLWVLEENHQARRFYEGLGGRLDGEKELEIAGLTLKEVAYGWDNITLIGERIQ